MTQPFNWKRLLNGIKPKVFSSKNPVINNQKLLLTYEGIIDKIELKKMISDISDYLYLEMGYDFEEDKYEEPDPNTNVTHLLVDFGKRLERKSKNCFDFNGIHPIIRVVFDDTQWINALKYIAHNDGDNEWIFKRYGNPSELKKHNHDYRTKIKDIDITRTPWYSVVLELDKIKPNNRDIHWLWDPVGGAGKTNLADYMEDNCDNRWIVITLIGSQKSLYERIKTAINNEGWKGHGIIIDLSRQCPEYGSLFSALEYLKNGRLSSSKYRRAELIIPSPHVVVFSSKVPLINLMSPDRWNIFKIHNYEATQIGEREVLEELIKDSRLVSKYPEIRDMAMRSGVLRQMSEDYDSEDELLTPTSENYRRHNHILDDPQLVEEFAPIIKIIIKTMIRNCRL